MEQNLFKSRLKNPSLNAVGSKNSGETYLFNLKNSGWLAE